MDLTQDEIVVFTELYKREYGATLSAEKATEELAKLRQLYKLVYLSPINKSSSTAMFPSNHL